MDGRTAEQSDTHEASTTNSTEYLVPKARDSDDGTGANTLTDDRHGLPPPHHSERADANKNSSDIDTVDSMQTPWQHRKAILDTLMAESGAISYMTFYARGPRLGELYGPPTGNKDSVQCCENSLRLEDMSDDQLSNDVAHVLMTPRRSEILRRCEEFILRDQVDEVTKRFTRSHIDFVLDNLKKQVWELRRKKGKKEQVNLYLGVTITLSTYDFWMRCADDVKDVEFLAHALAMGWSMLLEESNIDLGIDDLTRVGIDAVLNGLEKKLTAYYKMSIPELNQPSDCDPKSNGISSQRSPWKRLVSFRHARK